MSTYNEAEGLVRKLRAIINQCIENHPLVKSAIKAQKAVIWDDPDTENHTVAIKFLPDILDGGSEAKIFPYNPNIPESNLKKGSTVFVWYYQSLSNGVIMQNANWSI